MMPNHLFQLVSLTAMEPPTSFEADAVRDERVEILRHLTAQPGDVLQSRLRGQYGPAWSGERLPAYRTEPDVAPDSATETFVAFNLALTTGVGLAFHSMSVPGLSRQAGCEIQMGSSAPFVLARRRGSFDAPNRLVLYPAGKGPSP